MALSWVLIGRMLKLYAYLLYWVAPYDKLQAVFISDKVKADDA